MAPIWAAATRMMRPNSIPPRLADLENDLSERRVGFHQLMRCRGFGQGKGAVQDRSDPAALERRQPALAETLHDSPLLGERLGTEGEAQDGKPSSNYGGRVEHAGRTAELPGEHQAPRSSEGGEIAGEGVGSDEVEDEVRTVAGKPSHLHCEILLLVVDGEHGAERTETLELPLAA